MFVPDKYFLCQNKFVPFSFPFRGTSVLISSVSLMLVSTECYKPCSAILLLHYGLWVLSLVFTTLWNLKCVKLLHILRVCVVRCELFELRKEKKIFIEL